MDHPSPSRAKSTVQVGGEYVHVVSGNGTISPSVLNAVGLMMGLTAAVLAGLVVGVKLLRARHRRSAAAAMAPHRTPLLVVASGEDDDGSSAAHLIAVDGRDWRPLAPAVVAMLSKVRGRPAEDLVEVLRRHGDIKEAVTSLQSRSPVRRARGVHLLGLVRDRAHSDHLRPLLSDRSAEVRLVTVRALGAIRDPALAGDILRALRSVRGEPDVPAHVGAETLLAMGAGTSVALREAMQSDDPRVRDVAALVAGHVNLVSAAPRLREMLSDPEPQVRLSAAHSLGLVGGADDVRVLAAAAGGAAGTVSQRRACAEALGSIGHQDAIQPLLDLLTDPDRRLAQIAAEALTRLGPAGMACLAQVPASGPAGRAAGAALAAAARRGTIAADA